MPLFEDDPAPVQYGFLPFSNAASLAKDFLLDYPRNKISMRWFKSMQESADIAGFCCTATTPEDLSILDSLLGYLDIPASMDGLKLDLVQTSKTKAYLVVYLSERIHQSTLRSLRIQILGKV